MEEKNVSPPDGIWMRLSVVSDRIASGEEGDLEMEIPCQMECQNTISLI